MGAMDDENLGKWQPYILLVEDDPIVQKVHSGMLQKLGCHVDIAIDGYQALQMLTDSPHYEVIFMDLGLPAMSGTETVEKIRQQEINKSIPIIGLTAYQVDDVKAECELAGFNKVVSKPISLEALKAILMEVTKQHKNART